MTTGYCGRFLVSVDRVKELSIISYPNFPKEEGWAEDAMIFAEGDYPEKNPGVYWVSLSVEWDEHRESTEDYISAEFVDFEPVSIPNSRRITNFSGVQTADDYTVLLLDTPEETS